MGKKSKIAWTDHTWNPWYGCKKVSAGCKNCYMFRDMGRTPFNPKVVTRAKDTTFRKPLHWKEPAKVFTCSWSDFFIEEADQWREEALEIIKRTPHLTYLILTKRPERILEYLVYGYEWGTETAKLPKNVWLGVSVENKEQAEKRIPVLMQIPARIRFLSCEPLLEPINLSIWMNKIDWIITGGESGPKEKIRHADIDWFRSIRNQCEIANIPFFHKQHGGSQKINGEWGGRELDGKTWNQFPEG